MSSWRPSQKQLLNCWRVLYRDLAVREGLRLPWREIRWALRRLEDRGLVRGWRLVGGFSDEQCALPTAVEQSAQVHTTPRTQERIVVNATDPLTLLVDRLFQPCGPINWSMWTGFTHPGFHLRLVARHVRPSSACHPVK